MLGLSPLELSVIALVIVLLFGTKRLPELGSGLGKAINNFRKSYKEGTAIDVTPSSENKEESPSSNDTSGPSTNSDAVKKKASS